MFVFLVFKPFDLQFKLWLLIKGSIHIDRKGGCKCRKLVILIVAVDKEAASVQKKAANQIGSSCDIL